MSDKYTSVLQSVLPIGRLFNRVVGSWLTRLLSGFAVELQRAEDATGVLITEGIPSTTNEMLPEWERAVSIPDEVIQIAGTTEQRRNNVLGRLSDTGGASIAYFQDRAAAFGFAGTTVVPQVNVSAFIIGTSAMGDTISEGTGIRGYPFRASVSRMGEPLRLYVEQTQFIWIVTFPTGSVQTQFVEADFERNKPAHTQIVFVSSNYDLAALVTEELNPITTENGDALTVQL